MTQRPPRPSHPETTPKEILCHTDIKKMQAVNDKTCNRSSSMTYDTVLQDVTKSDSRTKSDHDTEFNNTSGIDFVRTVSAIIINPYI